MQLKIQYLIFNLWLIVNSLFRYNDLNGAWLSTWLQIDHTNPIGYTKIQFCVLSCNEKVDSFLLKEKKISIFCEVCNPTAAYETTRASHTFSTYIGY